MVEELIIITSADVLSLFLVWSSIFNTCNWHQSQVFFSTKYTNICDQRGLFQNFICIQRCRHNGKCCWPWSDCSLVWSEFTLFVQACLSKILGSCGTVLIREKKAKEEKRKEEERKAAQEAIERAQAQGNLVTLTHICLVDCHPQYLDKSISNFKGVWCAFLFLYPWHLCRGVYSFHLSICMFIRSFFHSFVLPSPACSWNYFKVLRASNSSGVYLTNHSSESIHIWTIGTLEGRLSFHGSSPQGLCPGVGLEVKI